MSTNRFFIWKLNSNSFLRNSFGVRRTMDIVENALDRECSIRSARESIDDRGRRLLTNLRLSFRERAR